MLDRILDLGDFLRGLLHLVQKEYSLGWVN